MINKLRKYAIFPLFAFAIFFGYADKAHAADVQYYSDTFSSNWTVFTNSTLSYTLHVTGSTTNVSKLAYACAGGPGFAATGTVTAYLCSGTYATTLDDCMGYGRHWLSGMVGAAFSCNYNAITENAVYFSQVISMIPDQPYYVVLQQTSGSGNLAVVGHTWSGPYWQKEYYRDNFVGASSSDTTALPDVATVFGTSTRGVVCTEDEWNATSTYLGMNFTVMKCSVMQSLIDVADHVAHYPAVTAQAVTGTFLTVFPLNVFSQIKSSWDSSATASLPSALAVIDIADTDGNVYVDQPQIGYSTTTKQLIFGPGLVSGNTTAMNFVAFVKALTTYIFWGLFILQVYNFALDTSESLGHKDE